MTPPTEPLPAVEPAGETPATADDGTVLSRDTTSAPAEFADQLRAAVADARITLGRFASNRELATRAYDALVGDEPVGPRVMTDAFLILAAAVRSTRTERPDEADPEFRRLDLGWQRVRDAAGRVDGAGAFADLYALAEYAGRTEWELASLFDAPPEEMAREVARARDLVRQFAPKNPSAEAV